MFANTLQMINNSIVDVKDGRDTAVPVIFNGLPDDEDLLTGLCHEQRSLYAAFLETAKRSRQIRPHHWANRNFTKAQVIGKDTFRHASIEIMNDKWNFLLKRSGQPTLHDVSMQTLKQVIHEGVQGHDLNHLDANPDF